MTGQNITPMQAANAILNQTVHEGSGIVRYQQMLMDPLFQTVSQTGVVTRGHGAVGELGFQMAVDNTWLRALATTHIITIQGRVQLAGAGAAPIRGGGTIPVEGRAAALSLINWTDQVGEQFNLLEMAFANVSLQSVAGNQQIEPPDIDIALAIEYARDQNWLTNNQQRYMLRPEGRQALEATNANA